MESLKIAQVAPLAEAVPPRLYGGTERVVSYLTEELVRLGHDVTLFASGDSRTRARLVAVRERATRLDDTCRDPLACQVAMIDDVMARVDDFDIIHSHLDYLLYPVARCLGVPIVTTTHNRLDMPELKLIYERYDHVPLVSISNNQREPVRRANWVSTVYHGLPLDLYDFTAEPEDYVAFIGRISPEKRLDSAIRVATRAGIKIKIAAKISTDDAEYFAREIRPLLDHPLVEFVGEIGEGEKNAFLGNAQALMFLVDWPEPFGLAMIEAMACGTPVIARRCGAIPEVVDDGITGFVCDDEDEAIARLGEVVQLDRAQVRAHFERRFSATRMARDYVEIYRMLIQPRATFGRGIPLPSTLA